MPGQAAMQSAYREWLLNEARAEVASGCATVFSIRGTLFSHFRNVVRGWPPEMVLHLMHARIKRLNWFLLSPLELTEQECAVVDRFSWPVHTYSTPGRPQVLIRYPHGLVSVDEDLRELVELRDRVHLKQFKVNRAELKKKVLGALRPLLGKPANMNGQHLFLTSMCGFTVETCIDVIRPALGQLEYSHSVYWGDVDLGTRQDTISLSQIGVSNLLGTAGITTWDHLTDPDIDAAADSLARVVGNFVRAFPGIVETGRRQESDA
jgi:hypothetical protein